MAGTLGLLESTGAAIMDRDLLQLLIASKMLIARQARRSRMANSGERVRRIEAELAAYRAQLEPRALEL